MTARRPDGRTDGPDGLVLSDKERSILAGMADLSRFDKVERVVHWVNATLFAVLMATGASLYVPFLSAMVGRREAVKTIHVYAGLMLPFPLLIGVVGRRWGRRLRGDLRRLNRWIADDAEWLRGRHWRRGNDAGGIRLGKFNPGQKLNAAFTGGAIILMLATGSIIRWYKPFALSWRTGATFVHDWVFIGLFFSITGHIMFALRDQDSLQSMWTGTVSRAWAGKYAPRWLAEVQEPAAPAEEGPIG